MDEGHTTGQGEGAPQGPEDAPAGAGAGTPSGDPEAPKLSAAYLPYDDERLWIGMPGTLGDRPAKRSRRKGQKQKQKQQKSKPSEPEATRPEPDRVSRLRRPVRVGTRRIAAAIVTLALPVSAFAVIGSLSDDVQIPVEPVLTGSPTLSPDVAPVTAIEGLRADDVTPKRVTLSWKALEGGAFTYVVYRDGIVLAKVDATDYVDTLVEPQQYYYYSIAAVLEDGSTASSPQLLVAVPSESGQLPSASAPPAPARPVIVRTPSPSPSPSPSKSPSPTKSKIVWPSIDFGGGVDPCVANPQSDPSCPGYDICLVNPSDPSCTPAPVTSVLPPLLLWFGDRRRRRSPVRTQVARSPERYAWPGA